MNILSQLDVYINRCASEQFQLRLKEWFEQFALLFSVGEFVDHR